MEGGGLYRAENVAAIFAPHVARQLRHLLESQEGGVSFEASQRNVGVSNARYGGKTRAEVTHPSCDRFTLHVQYYAIKLTWEVIFQSARVRYPPDFIFDDARFRPNMASLPHLVNWNHEDPAALLNVVQDLMRAYGEYQDSLITDRGRAQITSIVEQRLVKMEDIALFVEPAEARSVRCNVWIRLPIEWNLLPPNATLAAANLNSEVELYAILQLSNFYGDTTAYAIKYSDALLHLFEGDLPPVKLKNRMSLLEAVQSSVGVLVDTVMEMKRGYVQRRHAMAALMAAFGTSLVEFDAIEYRHVTFLLCPDEVGGAGTGGSNTFCLVTVAHHKDGDARVVIRSVYGNTIPMATRAAATSGGVQNGGAEVVLRMRELYDVINTDAIVAKVKDIVHAHAASFVPKKARRNSAGSPTGYRVRGCGEGASNDACVN